MALKSVTDLTVLPPCKLLQKHESKSQLYCSKWKISVSLLDFYRIFANFCWNNELLIDGKLGESKAALTRTSESGLDCSINVISQSVYIGDSVKAETLVIIKRKSLIFANFYKVPAWLFQQKEFFKFVFFYWSKSIGTHVV